MPLRPGDMVSPTHFLPEDHMEVRNPDQTERPQVSRRMISSLYQRVRTLMTEKTIHLKTMGAEHIASTTVSLGRPQPVVAQ